MNVEFLLSCFSLILVSKTGVSDLTETSMSTDHLVCSSLVSPFHAKKEAVKPSLQGPVGAIGMPGLQGPLGTIDYSEMDSLIDKEFGRIKARLAKVEKEMKIIDDQAKNGKDVSLAKDSKYRKECIEKYSTSVHYGSMCYMIVGSDETRFTVATAEKACLKIGGYLADLPSYEVYKLIFDYVDHTFDDEITVWTGMRLDLKTRKAVLATGQEAAYSKWSSGFPDSTDDSYLYIKIDASERSIGMKNYDDTAEQNYALCEFNVDGNPRPAHETDDDDYYSYVSDLPDSTSNY